MPPRAKVVPNHLILFGSLCVVLGLLTSIGVAWGITFAGHRLGRSGYLEFAVPEVDGSGYHRYVGNYYEGSGATRFEFYQTTDTPIPKTPDPAYHLHRLTSDAATPIALEQLSRLVNTHGPEHAEATIHLKGWPGHCLSFAVVEGWNVVWPPSPPQPPPKPYVVDYKDFMSSGPAPIQRSTAPPAPRAGPTSVPVFNETLHAFTVGQTTLPLFPLWPGLIANTALYGIAWAFLTGAVVLARRWFRARKGNCSHCGYSREGLKQDAPCPECGRVPAAATKAATPAHTIV